MTREKREILKRIDELQQEMTIDKQLSFGCAPEGAYDFFYEAIDALQEKLAHLCHHDSYVDMVMDPRWLAACRPAMEELPFA